MSRRARGLSLLLACAILPAPSWSDAPAVSPRPQARIVLVLEPPARPVARPVEVPAEPAGLTNPGPALETEGALESWPAPISGSISNGPLRPQHPEGPLEVPLLLTRDGSLLLPDLRVLDPATQPRGPLLSRALVPEPSARLAAQEARVTDSLEISDGTAQIARMLVQNMAVGTRPERIASSIAPRPTSPPQILPAVRPVPRPTTTASPLPPRRPEPRPARPLAVVPLMGTDALTPVSPEAQSGAVVPPDLSALAVALALRPPERPPEITRQAQQVREQRARGAVCGSVDIQGQTLSRINGSGECGWTTLSASRQSAVCACPPRPPWIVQPPKRCCDGSSKARDLRWQIRAVASPRSGSLGIIPAATETDQTVPKCQNMPRVGP